MVHAILQTEKKYNYSPRCKKMLMLLSTVLHLCNSSAFHTVD